MIEKITQKIMPIQAQKPLSPTPKFMNLGTWGRFQVSPVPKNVIDACLCRSGGEKRFSGVCLHCQETFKTNRENQQFCRPGHRTYNNRLKRARLVEWFQARGMSHIQADEWIEKKGLSVLVKTMLASGWTWTGRAWVQKA